MREMSTYDGDVFAYADDIIDEIERKEITKILDLKRRSNQRC
jgi:hypothetical protein